MRSMYYLRHSVALDRGCVSSKLSLKVIVFPKSLVSTCLPFPLQRGTKQNVARHTEHMTLKQPTLYQAAEESLLLTLHCWSK